ncbi:CDP-diacylglycerol-inositol 3-phosphatidyltransferase, eukaryote [Kipferlia bialata]|uniref:CDP-diacylglycerol--inositol 3-phosphatidyltransferase n=1 Tax=Kipferlia bialata TaxID=797122 RepID=A0A9K3GF11_9EUKA|nr:CDP-diacylglycerol-inositol 3-phosphatidyltransferase, eukaryote [Kipferlia bialata]|eukprot:g1192.t1
MTSVFLYWPNLIGFTRIILALIAFTKPYTHPIRLFCCYTVSFILDAFDGLLARRCNQCTALGAVLDMVTDRAGTTAVCALLVHMIPNWTGLWIFLIFLDLLSHWMAMYASVSLGEQSHKDVSGKPFLVRVYYQNKVFLGTVCTFYEGALFFLLMTTLSYGWVQTFLRVWAYVFSPGAVFKALVSVYQLVDAMQKLAALETAAKTEIHASQKVASRKLKTKET